METESSLTKMTIIEFAKKLDLSGWPHYFKEEQIPEIMNPDWETGGNVHNWKNYISGELQEFWLSLSEETRLVAWSFAEHQSMDEEWD